MTERGQASKIIAFVTVNRGSFTTSLLDLNAYQTFFPFKSRCYMNIRWVYPGSLSYRFGSNSFGKM